MAQPVGEQPLLEWLDQFDAERTAPAFAQLHGVQVQGRLSHNPTHTFGVLPMVLPLHKCPSTYACCAPCMRHGSPT